ncbi:hypothetical protein [Desulfovibrio piger]|uniref:hypothetical protein n=1 Tax=Desulfovibrio piger TaxID=901 RepID=UPI0026F306A7|nr:hypothetical protein [Desulfovibrio piger]
MTTTTAIMDDSRRYKALAKADLVRQYLAWQRKFGATRAQKDAFVTAYKAGAWPKLLEEVGSVSWQTLERWKLEQERAGSVLALADKRGVAHRGRTALTERHQMLYKVVQTVNANVLADDRPWLEAFSLAFAAALPRGGNDSRGNWVRVRAQQATFERSPDKRVGHQVIEVVTRVNRLFVISFTWRITGKEAEVLIPTFTIKPKLG